MKIKTKSYQSESKEFSDRDVYDLFLSNRSLVPVGVYWAGGRIYKDLVYHIHEHTVIAKNTSPPIVVFTEGDKDIKSHLEELIKIKLEKVK